MKEGNIKKYLNKPFDWRAYEIQSMIDEGRTEDAKTRMVEFLEEGSATPEVQKLAIQFIKPPKRPRGKQPQKYPKNWYKIGKRFWELTDEGMKYEEALFKLEEELKEEFGKSKSHTGRSGRHIEECASLYKKATEAHDQACREFSSEDNQN